MGTKMFMICGEVYTEREMRRENEGDAGLLAWLDECQAGDVFPDGESVECVDDGTREEDGSLFMPFSLKVDASAA